ncbi:LacI family transcriptional regulator [Mycolicibacterium wolinskyi]|uniref:LacI family transcriptional regulator n=1 Tax=Mycolicibacterium wolinskyi TaxID=59750 RepID=A0A132PTD2_9MYCO|nr:LacI family DNA-binding transcriptional regulator [Mycolicibacterium wolinskyi]KWX25591.1 LacI family transcriptional regulator [Mycolicibacterium wolinskyi]
MAGGEERRRRAAAATSTATMADVAELAGVSAQTVSRVLRQPHSVSETTRRKVHEAIRASGYVPNRAASHLASNQSHTVAAILPVLSASVFADTMQAASAVLSPAGYQIQLGYTDYRTSTEEDLIRNFLGWRPDGFFIVGALHTPAAAAMLRSADVPIVETWGWSDQPLDLLVGFSNRRAIADLVRALVAKGHEKLAFAGVLTPGDERAAERRAGFTEVVEELFPGQPLRIVNMAEEPVAMRTGRKLLERVVGDHPDVTAAVFSSDIFAAGAVLSAKRLGIDVPADLAITGFGDFEISAMLEPALTTVAIDAEAIGARAAEILLDRMRGEEPPARQLDVGYTIRMRDSA